MAIFGLASLISRREGPFSDIPTKWSNLSPQFEGLATAAWDLLTKLSALLTNLGAFFQSASKAIFYFAFFYIWFTRYRARMNLARFAVRLFLIYGFLEVLEKLVKLLATSLTGILRRHSHVQHVFESFLRLLDGRVALILFAVIGLIVIYHHWREPAHHHYEITTLKVIQTVLEPISKLNLALSRSNADSRPPLETSYYDVLSKAMSGLFAERNIPDLNLSIMRWDAGTARLEIVYDNSSSSPRYAPSITFSSGEGAAGIAFERNLPVYVPYIQYRHGVLLDPAGNVTEMKPVYHAYKPEKNDFNSMIAVPIRDDSFSAIGVVNLSSREKGPLRGTDFDIAKLTATILGLMNRG